MTDEAHKIYTDEVENCDRIARTALSRSSATAPKSYKTRKLNVLTHCNTGTLACCGIGTALGVIRLAWKEGSLNASSPLKAVRSCRDSG